MFEHLFRGGDLVGRVSDTRLCLSAVRHLVAERGGSIDVQTESRRGSAVVVRVPLSPVRPAATCDRLRPGAGQGSVACSDRFGDWRLARSHASTPR